MEKITLYYRQGSSDKIYQASIDPKDGKFVVNFAYGRRGTTLSTGTKTSSAVEYLLLMNLIASGQQRHIKLVHTGFLTEQKQEMLDSLRKQGSEGVVFKHLSGHYASGRPASGGSQFKFKFCESASFIVGKVNSKRSVSLKLFDGTDLVSVGNVTIPANKSIPQPNDVVEVKYLYAFKGGSIFQPVFIGKRDDVKPEECTTDQLKYKAEAVAA